MRQAAALGAPLIAIALSASAQLVPIGTERIVQSDLGGLVEAQDVFGSALAAGDFDGNGVDDVAVGAPGEDVGAIGAAGAVFVSYNSTAGIGAARAPLVLHQDIEGVAGVAEVSDGFGSVLAAGNVNGDAYDDLAVGVPDEDGGELADVGAVHLFLGSASGLVPAGSGHLLQAIHFDGLEFETEAELGAALVFCDRDLDGLDELVIGAPSTGFADEPTPRAGRIVEVPGVANGVDASEAIVRVAPDSDGGDEFGFALACGKLAAGEGEFLLVGAPGAFDDDGIDRVGGVWYLDESGAGNRLIDGAGPLDRSGEAVVLGRFNNSHLDQPIWSAPADDHFATHSTGKVYNQDFILEQDGGGNGDPVEVLDQFGRVLAAGDFDDNGYGDLVVGTPFEDISIDDSGFEVGNGGIVQVLAGPIGSGPPRPFVSKLTWPSPFGVEIHPSVRLGRALAVGDFDGDEIDDLAIGAPGADWNGANVTGIVEVVFGSRGLIFADGFATGDVDAWSGP